jgi:hypothetical protein
MKVFYGRLLELLRDPVVRDGEWRLLECVPAWERNWTVDGFVVFAWEGANGKRLLAAVNYAPNQSQCYVRLPFASLGGREWRLKDALGDARYERSGDELQSRGLYLDMAPWQAQLFSIDAIAAQNAEKSKGKRAASAAA